ncbi:MAG: leucine-rich repeat domain-containing protein [Clostridia bacterium]|nr:leucine-rich repeat domain-containing protein [Clostridia bacterium]
MKLNFRKITALCLAALMLAVGASCGGETSDDPIEMEPVTLPDPADDREMPDDAVKDYQDKLNAAFGGYDPVPAEDLTYTLSEDGTEVTLTGYEGGEVIVVLPDHIDGLPVTAIDEAAFEGLGNLKALYIPDSVEVMGFGALKDCKSLSTLRTPVVEVTAYPYFGALFGAASYEINASEVPDALTTVIVGGGVETIPSYGFYDCNSITCVGLPETVKTVEKFAFWGCYGLEYINLDETALTSVGDRAFTNCAALLRFDLPATVTSVGEAVVEGCGAMCAMTLPFVGGSATENTYLGYLFGALSYTFTAGYIPASLQEITLLAGCTVIPNNAFFEVSCLSEITIPDSVTSVGLRAFYGCERLRSITLPDSVTIIGDDAFHGCFRLQEVNLGSGLKHLGVQAFMDCLMLKNVTLPANLTSIPNSCFAGCISLETVTSPGVISADSVGWQAYRHCDKLTEAPFMPVEMQAAE